MKLSELSKLAENDLTVDESSLDKKSLEVSLLYSKWLKLLYEHSLHLQAKKMELDEETSKLWKYYREDYEYSLSQKEIQLLVDSSEEIRQLKAIVYTLDQKVKFIEGVLKSINQLSFNIRNAIEWKKFENGVI